MVAGLVLAAGLFAGGTRFGAHVWPGAETKVRTEVVEKTWGAEDRCEKAWTDYAIASAGGGTRDRFLYERLGKVCPPELRP